MGNLQLTPYQDLKKLARECFTKDRTTAAEGCRKEHVALEEVDLLATRGDVDKLEADDKMLLNTIRTGTMWTKTAGYWAGHVEDMQCTLCGAAKETMEHLIWYCTALAKDRGEACSYLGKCNPDILPAPIKCGIAPAVGSDPTKPFRGVRAGGVYDIEHMSMKEAKLIGCSMKAIPADCRQIIEDDQGRSTAKALTQCFTRHDAERYLLPLPKRCNQKAPDYINCYSDGSLLHSKGDSWRIGGQGVGGRTERMNPTRRNGNVERGHPRTAETNHGEISQPLKEAQHEARQQR